MPSRPTRLAWGVPPLITLTLGGCTAGEASPAGTLPDAIENASEDQVVDDVSILHDSITGDLSIGGVAITGLPYFQGLDFSPDNDNTQVPLSWPILRLSIGEDPVNLFRGYAVGVVVLEQTTMATTDSSRAALFEQGFAVSAESGGEIVDTGSVDGTVEGRSRSCWWEARRGIGERLMMVIAGDGVASSAVTVSIPIDGPSAAQVAADLAEAACGARAGGA